MADYDEIAARLGFGRSSVFRALRKLGCSRLGSLEVKPPPVRRYQWEKPGQMLHLDIKRLGRIDGVATERQDLDKFIAAVRAGNICMFALMTLRGWRTWRFTQTRRGIGCGIPLVCCCLVYGTA